MPQTFACLHYHIIFGTKHRTPAITPVIQLRLYDYIGGIVRAEGGTLVAAGGVADHVHLLARLGTTRPIADVLRTIKANASKWVRDSFPDADWFGWQTGYAAFAVSMSGLPAVKDYLAGQAEHHRMRSFADEYREFLTRHGIPFDECDLWD